MVLVVVMDTVSLKHLLRSPRASSKSKTRPRLETALDSPMKKKNLKLALDKAGGLISEWEQTCGEEIIGVVVTRWVDLNAIVIIDNPHSLGAAVSKKLRQLGFTDTIDKLILRIAVATEDRIVVSDDDDFWDPSSTMRRGEKDAPVAKLCREELATIITLLGPLLRRVS